MINKRPTALHCLKLNFLSKSLKELKLFKSINYF